MRHSHESLYEVLHALVALAQPAILKISILKKAVGLFFLVVYYIYMQSDVLRTDILSCAN